jgi:hypothetical protein
MVKFLIFVVLGIVAFLVLRKIQEPKAGSERLAITVWAAFGPYETAEIAEDRLHRACRTVFGPKGIVEHEKWMEGHIKNFRDWQAEGTFQRKHKIQQKPLLLTAHGQAFQEACHKMKIEALDDARASLEELRESSPDIAEMLQSAIDSQRKRLNETDEQE